MIRIVLYFNSMKKYTHNVWSEDEINWLKLNYSIFKKKKSAIHLNRSIGSIGKMAGRLGLSTPRIQNNLEKQTKICTKCKIEKAYIDFGQKKSIKKDGLRSMCKMCESDKYYDNWSEVRRRQRNRYKNDEGFRKNFKQYQLDYKDNLHKDSYKLKRYFIKRIMDGARQRSKKKNWHFDLDLEWLMSQLSEKCPIFGIEYTFLLRKGTRDSSPSLDRIDSTKGYTKDNVIIVSWLANKFKNQATVEQLGQLYFFYKNLQE